MNHLGTLLASHVLLGDVKVQLLRDLLTVRLSIDLEEDIHFKQVMLCSCGILPRSLAHSLTHSVNQFGLFKSCDHRQNVQSVRVGLVGQTCQLLLPAHCLGP